MIQDQVFNIYIISRVPPVGQPTHVYKRFEVSALVCQSTAALRPTAKFFKNFNRDMKL